VRRLGLAALAPTGPFARAGTLTFMLAYALNIFVRLLRTLLHHLFCLFEALHSHLSGALNGLLDLRPALLYQALSLNRQLVYPVAQFVNLFPEFLAKLACALLVHHSNGHARSQRAQRERDP
jgi:hypothetical protein